MKEVKIVERYKHPVIRSVSPENVMYVTVTTVNNVCRCSVVCTNCLRPHGLQSARLLLPMEFFRQEYWSELPFSPSGDLPHTGIKPASVFYALVFWLQGMWNPCSQTRDWTPTPCTGRWSLNHLIAREVSGHNVLKDILTWKIQI